MKIALILMSIFICQFSFSQTMKEKREKKEILDRLALIIGHVEKARSALDIEDVSSTCDHIQDIFKILPDHLIAIGTKMNFFDNKVIRIEEETRVYLIDIHRKKLICAKGNKGENLDMGETSSDLKKMQKAFKKQLKTIEKLDTDYNNNYNYWYEF